MVQMKETGPAENADVANLKNVDRISTGHSADSIAHNINHDSQVITDQTQANSEITPLIQEDVLVLPEPKYTPENEGQTTQETNPLPRSVMEQSSQASGQQTYQTEVSTSSQVGRTQVTERRVRRPVLKKTFALKKVGYKVIPYEDESDSRYSFTNENVVFVNKANSTYRAEASRGDEFLLRHIIGIVAEAIAETKYPEGKEALELQNRLIAEAIRIHDDSVIKKV
jgi:hypothetical protein